jgi:hypothetical protein
MCCLGAPIALLWRFRELLEDLASFGPLPGLLSAAASLHISCSVVALLLCVVAFSSLLPFCCYHFTLCPFLWSLPLYFVYNFFLSYRSNPAAANEIVIALER